MKLKISVAMTACNSELYIKDQIDSVLPQLGEQGQLVISVDPSTDSTMQILQAFALEDSRIQLVQGKGNGLIANFENAVGHTTGDIIFLCDHDDVWYNNKVAEVMACFADESVSVVVHDAVVCDAKMQQLEPSFMEWRGTKEGYGANLIKNSFIGCCMAFRKELKPLIMPFPSDLPMHDQWIGLMGYRHGKVLFLRKPLLFYRRHDANMSSSEHAGVLQMLRWRFQLIKSLSKRR